MKNDSLITKIKKGAIVYILGFVFFFIARIIGELIGAKGLQLDMPKDLAEIFMQPEKLVWIPGVLALLVVFAYFIDTREN